MIDTIIVSGGNIHSDFALDFLKKNEACLIAADKGLEFSLEHQLLPDAVIGDFDSLSEDGKKFLEIQEEKGMDSEIPYGGMNEWKVQKGFRNEIKEIKVIRLRPEKDDSDTQSAMNYAIRTGAKEIDGVMTAKDSLTYNEEEIRRIAKRGFDIAMKRRKKVTSVDKANVLDSSRLWRKVVEEVAKDYPEVAVENMLVDNCAMQLVKDPKQFDVILTENMFGDILSDEASMVTGSIGMLASASLNETKFGLYEPSGGSAPDIAGKGIANPIATILSAAMMLRFSFDLDKEADAIEAAVAKVLKDGYRTIDIMSEGKTQIGTEEMGDLISENIR